MDPLKRRELLDYFIPPLEISTMAAAFYCSILVFGQSLGYLLGFFVYWIVWCVVIPGIIVGRKKLVHLFIEEEPLLRKKNWDVILFITLVFAISLFMYWPNLLAIGSLSPSMLLLIILFSLIGPTSEEILWRGTFITLFPQNKKLNCLFPAIGFAIWHLVPLMANPESGDTISFVISTFFLGITYGWIASRRNSIKWPVITHVFGSILAFAEPLAGIVESLL